MQAQNKQKILILYHFYKPDDVISARHFSDLAEGLVERGWDVTVLTSDRYCRDSKREIFPKIEKICGVKVIRMSRPGLDQGKNISRMANSAWISTKWLLKILFSGSYDAILLGTDPQMGYLICPLIKLFKRKTKIAMWAFDLYPEAIQTMEPLPLWIKALTRMVSPFAGLSYKSMDLIVDIGDCMRKRIEKYQSKAKVATLIPWAISEPGEIKEPDPEIRHKLFSNSKLTLLYSGTIGQAHTFTEFIELARELRRRKADISICFAGRGNRYSQLREMVTEEDTNITFAGFANERELPLRLTAADIHLISLREGWEGLVVPSKFFGSIAAGRPLIYAGTPDSAIKKWLNQYNIGLYLDSSNINIVADKLIELSDNPDKIKELQARTFETWQSNFAREQILDSFDLELGKMIGIYSEMEDADYIKRKISEISHYKVDPETFCEESQGYRLNNNAGIEADINSEQDQEKITKR